MATWKLLFLLLLGLTASVWAYEPIGMYAGLASHRFVGDMSMRKAERTVTRMDTGAVLSFDDYKADPDISYSDVQNREMGYGFRVGYRKPFSEAIGLDVFIEYGFLEGDFSFTEKDTGGAVQKENFSSDLAEDTGYMMLGIGMYGELPGKVKGHPLSWTAGIIRRSYDARGKIESDAGNPSTIHEHILFADMSLEATFGITLEGTRIFLGLQKVNQEMEYSWTEKDFGAGPPAEKDTREFKGEWKAGMLMFLGAEAGSEKFRGFARYYLNGASGVSVGMTWLF